MKIRVVVLASTTIILAAGIAVALSLSSHPGHSGQADNATPAAAVSPAARDFCSIAVDANTRAQALIAGMTMVNSASELAKAAAIYSQASRLISDSGEPLLRTQAGHVLSDLALAALQADRLVVDIRYGMNGDFRKQSEALLSTEMKITTECNG